ncbi:MAG: TlpA disulfide reductase family protein [Armatimonadota bacterium]|nr:TlpA family protein disulfide reductase [bacterium]MCS7309729.1 TlpA family protein disulfide reductase [Armatimonadota bacterium]MDW8104257.1 TlpA disulfide reductase family protein [Armatimonadota bacterium]MDW8289784.1 TlpA disulfide reductase family protein [Armatimonadota bacterium]
MVMVFGNIGDPFWTRAVQFLEKMHQQYASKGIVIVAIAFDQDRQAVKAFVDKHKLTLPVAVDDAKLTGAERYRITATPLTLFLDKGHRVTVRQLGFSKQHEKLFEQEIQKLVQ